MKVAIILKRAIEKAEKGGYNFPFSDIVLSNLDMPLFDAIYGKYTWVPRIIFSHDFAKAFWGEEKDEWKTREGECLWTEGYGCEYSPQFLPLWQIHLQKMVLEKEPVEYLSQFLDKEEEK